jgi:hypothetical protein
MPLSTVSRIGFDADVAHLRGEFKRPTPPQKRRNAELTTSEAESEVGAFLIVSEGAPSTAGLSILAQALAAYSEN